MNGDTDVFASDGATITRDHRDGRRPAESYSGRACVPRPATTARSSRSCPRPPTSCPATPTRATDVFVRNASPGPPSACRFRPASRRLDADWVTISHDGRFIAYNRGAVVPVRPVQRHDQTVSAATPAAPRPRAPSRASAPAAATSCSSRPRPSIGRRHQRRSADVYRFDRLTGDQRPGEPRRPTAAANAVVDQPDDLGRRQSGRVRVVGVQSGRRRRQRHASDVFVRNMRPARRRPRQHQRRRAAGDDRGTRRVHQRRRRVRGVPALEHDAHQRGHGAVRRVRRRAATAPALRGPLNGATEGTGTSRRAPTIRR